MNEEKNEKKITLSTSEIKIGNDLYDQDIGQEVRIDVEESVETEIENTEENILNPKEDAFMETVPEEESNSKEIDSDEEIKSEENTEENDSDEEPKEESNSEEKDSDEEPKEESNSEEITNKEENKEIEKKENLKKPTSNPENELQSDTKIIKISLIIVIVLGLILLIMLLTRHKVEKNKPEIKLVGDETVILEVGEKYNELGYFAVDAEDGDITNKVNIVGEVDTSKEGIYDLKYKVLDSDRTKTEVYRHVVIKSTKHNFDFKLKGQEFVAINVNADYIEEGYEASLNGQNVGDDVKVFGTVDRSKPGNYSLYYVLNSNNKVAVLKRIVIVHKGDEMNSDTALIADLNNWLVDEVHVSNEIKMENISEPLLLYFGALNCRNDRTEIPHNEMIECLKEKLNLKNVTLHGSTKYVGKTADISYNKNKDAWIINKLELPRVKDNISKIIVENNNIYLYELYGYSVSLTEELCDGSDNKIYYSGIDMKNVIGYESCINNCNGDNCNKTVNQDYELVPYLHTFRSSNGKDYRLISSEMLK